MDSTDSDEEEDEDEEDQEEADEAQWEEEAVANEVELSEFLSSTIKKVRRIVLFFKRSPSRNDKLQKAFEVASLKPLSLLLDMKTRWNTMLSMVKRFLETKGTIAKVLVELSSINLYPSEEELKLLQETVDALEVIESASLALGKRDCDLQKSEKIFQFVVHKLGEQRSEIGKALLEAVTDRIKERRNATMSGLLIFLDDPAGFSAYETEKILPFPPKSELVKAAKDIFMRLHQKHLPFPKSDEQDKEEEEEPSEKVSRHEELADFLSQKKKKKVSSLNRLSSAQDVLKVLKKEVTVLEATGIRPSLLEKIYLSLVTLPATSVEVERSFSAAGLFVTKLRTSLNDETINKLFLIRSRLLQNS